MADPWADFADAPSKPSLDPRHRDLAIRTIYGEAAQEPDDGKAAVAAVIKNRVQAGRYGGDSVPRVVLAPNQFEPWSRQDARTRMMALKPGDPAYDGIGQIVDRVWSGDMPDPTNGATHFFAPQAQQALGRQPPKWAQGEGQPIGRHTFYAPEGRVAQPQPSDPWAGFSDAPTKITVNPVAGRFAEPPAVDNAQALQAGLQQRGRDLTTGPATSPSQRMAIEHGNLLGAASQGATPNMDILSKNLISTDVFEGDDGSVLYRDPQTGQVQPTDNTKHIVMRDPADNTPKVYARTPDAEENGAVGVARVLAPGLMTGAVTRRPSIPSTAGVQPKASDIFSTSKPHYREFDRIAKEVPVNNPGAVVERLRGAMEAQGVPEKYIDEVLSSAKSVFAGTAPKELSGMARVEAEMNRLPTEVSPGKPLFVDALRRAKEQMGGGFQSAETRVRQGTGIATNELKNIIGELAPDAGQALRRADEVHSTAVAVRELQRKSDIADLRKGRAGYGGNAVNSMRQVLSPIVQKSIEGKTTSFKPDEIAAMREIVEGNWATNTARVVGQASPFKGIIASGGAATAGYALGPAVGATIAGLGMASNKLATILTGKQIERLQELVAKRSPEYAKAVEKAVERYEKAQMEMVNNPAPNKLAAYVSASRALSAGLTRDGIQVSSGDLMKLLNSPSKVAAEDQEPGPRIPSQ